MPAAAYKRDTPNSFLGTIPVRRMDYSPGPLSHRRSWSWSRSWRPPPLVLRRRGRTFLLCGEAVYLFIQIIILEAWRPGMRNVGPQVFQHMRHPAVESFVKGGLVIR